MAQDEAHPSPFPAYVEVSLVGQRIVPEDGMECLCVQLVYDKIGRNRLKKWFQEDAAGFRRGKIETNFEAMEMTIALISSTSLTNLIRDFYLDFS